MNHLTKPINNYKDRILVDDLMQSNVQPCVFGIDNDIYKPYGCNLNLALRQGVHLAQNVSTFLFMWVIRNVP